MNKIIVVTALFFVALTFVSCQNKQTTIEEQNTSSTITNSANEDVSTTSEVEKEIT